MFLLVISRHSIPRLSPHTASSGVREPCIEAISSVGHSVSCGDSEQAVVGYVISILSCYNILFPMAPSVFITVWTPMIVLRWRRPSLPPAVSVSTLVLLLPECVKR